VVNFGVLGVMRNIRSDRIGRAMFCERYRFPFLSDTLSCEQHMLYADSSPVSGGSVFIKMTRGTTLCEKWTTTPQKWSVINFTV